MTARSLRPCDGAAKRTDAPRFAEVEETLREEERDALRTAVLGTSLRDRSAVEAVADALNVEPPTVYNWLEHGRASCRALRDFIRLQDACIAGKGSDNPKAYELARLICRRYLAPAPGEGPIDQLGAVAAAVKEPVESAQALMRLLESVQAARTEAERERIVALAAEAKREIEEGIQSLRIAYRLVESLEAGADTAARAAIAEVGGVRR